MSKDSKPTFLNAEGRRECWSSRDDFFECLTENAEDGSKCADLKKIFESQCPKTWVGHFVRRRDFLKYKDSIETGGFVPAEEKQQATS